MSHVLFVCRQNAGRSQMSQALFERSAQGRHTASSAGTTPAGHVHPEVILVMREVGIDIAGRIPRLLTSELAERADLVITMGCGDQCPYIPGKRYIDWELPDPAGQSLDAVRGIREEIALRIEDLLARLDAADGPGFLQPTDAQRTRAADSLAASPPGNPLDMINSPENERDRDPAPLKDADAERDTSEEASQVPSQTTEAEELEDDPSTNPDPPLRDIKGS